MRTLHTFACDFPPDFAALMDPRTGTYLNENTMQHECIAFIGGTFCTIGGYDPRLPPQAKAASECKIWGIVVGHNSNAPRPQETKP